MPILEQKHQEVEGLEKIKFVDEPYFTLSYYNYEGNRSLYSKLQKMVELAIKEDSYILVSTLYLNSFEVLELLLDAVKILKGKVYILIGNSELSSCSFDRHGMMKKLNILDLESKGILIRKNSGAHLKFLIAGKRCMVFTTNLSSDGLFYNPEFGLTFDDEPWINTCLKQVFRELWHKNSEKALINGNWNDSIEWYPDSKLSEIINEKRNKNFAPLILSSRKLINLIHQINKNFHNQTLYQFIIDLLKQAKESIEISIYSFYPIDKIKEIKEILIHQANKGVIIKILVPEIQVKRNKSMYKLLKSLKQNRISVRYYREIHGKIIIIDSKRFLLFTGNFNYYLLKKNSYDLGICTKKDTIVQNAIKFYDLLWKEASESPHEHPNLNLNLELVIKSANFIADRKRVDISLLENLIFKSKEIQLISKDEKYVLAVNGAGKSLIIPLEVIEMEEIDNYLTLNALILPQPNFQLKLGDIYKIKNLNLTLFWPK